MPDFLTRKIGPLPAWAYGLLGAGIFFLYRRQKAAATAAAGGTTSTNYTATTPNVPTESVTTPSGFSYTGPAGGASYYIPQGAMGATNGNSTPQVGTFTGLGYSSPTGVGGSSTSTSGLGFSELQNWAQAQSLLSSGQPLFYEPTPGTFLPASSGAQLTIPGGTNTPLFLQQAQ